MSCIHYSSDWNTTLTIFQNFIMHFSLSIDEILTGIAGFVASHTLNRHSLQIQMPKELCAA